MTARRRSTVLIAVLAATLLLQMAAPVASAGWPRARHYHPGGPITLDTNLLSRSGASAWAIDAYLRARTSLPPLGAAFVAAEQRYGVNARFLLAAALHESAWGTSYISRVKHNLFGYNAYDRDPFRYATAYRTYVANIDATAKFIKASYLTPGGRWWGGQPTLRSMQRFWSPSGRWGEGVSRVASSIHLATLSGRSIRFASPDVGGTLHAGDQVSIRLTWTGGVIPAGIEFVATWMPVALDSDGITTTPSAPAKDQPTPVRARRARSAAHAITLTVAAPRQPGSYRLRLAMLDVRGRPLPRADRVPIAPVGVRIWADRAASVSLEPGADGTGVTVRITNTGRQPIPAMRSWVPSPASYLDVRTARSVVTVTASSDDPANPGPVVLRVEPLAADLAPGASVAFDVPGIDAATGRTTNWLAVDLSVLDDPTWLTPYLPVGAWRSDAGLGTVTRGGPVDPQGAPLTDATPAMPMLPALPAATPVPTPTATPTPTPTATPTPTPAPKPAPTPTPAPASTPTPERAAAPRPPVTRTYSEHNRAVVYRGRWGDAQAGGYLGGNVAWATSPGATARFTFTGSSVAWIGPLGPTRGRALILVDGRVAGTVNLWRSTFVARAVLFKRTFRTAGRHTLTIKVLDSPGPGNVSIDGFTVRT